MSQPTDGQGDPQYGGYQPQQGQSLGQGYDPNAGQPQQPAYGQPQGYGQPQQPGYGQAPQQQQQPAPQPQQPQQGGFGQSASQFTSGAGAVADGAGEGIGDLFGDLQFKKSLTEKLASLVFLGVIVWAVLHFVSNLFYNFGSDDYGATSVKHMGTGTAIVQTITDLVWLVLIVGVIRILLELAINVARLAKRKN